MTDGGTARGLVLVVDDEPEIRLLCRTVLELEGFAVVEAGDGTSAVEAAASARPDIVLLDLMLPDIDGWEVLERLHARADTANVVVIVMSARTGVDDQLRGWTEGVLEYVTKPFDPIALVELVARALQPVDADTEAARRERIVEGLRSRKTTHGS